MAMKVAVRPSLKPTPCPKTLPRLKKVPLISPEPMDASAPIGETANRRRMLSAGVSVCTGSAIVVMVVGTSANENKIDAKAKGTKPKRSPAKMSHWPSAIETQLTVMYAANTLPRSSLPATTLSQLSITMYKPTIHSPVVNRRPPQNQGLVHSACNMGSADATEASTAKARI